MLRVTVEQPFYIKKWLLKGLQHLSLTVIAAGFVALIGSFILLPLLPAHVIYAGVFTTPLSMLINYIKNFKKGQL